MTKQEAIKILRPEMPLLEESLKKAYKIAVQQYHPDNHPQNDGMFLKVKEAYSLLKDQVQEKPVRIQETSGHRLCPRCGGRGKRKTKTRTRYGMMVLNMDCAVCKGTGYVDG